MSEDIVIGELNDKQKKAVEFFKGPLLIVAGAGAGKTRVLTHRVANLIVNKGIKPWNILAVTFTNKAAQEMQDRIAKLLKKCKVNTTAQPHIGTFHSQCVKILRKNIHLLGFENQFTIYDTADQEILMKRIMEARHMDIKKVTPRSILNHISRAKNELIDPTEYEKFVSNYFTEKVSELYYVYQEELQKNNALDFDDLIMKVVELFKKEKQILEYYQDKFQFINVDEYQDTNHAQYTLVKMLAEKYRNICVIGDSDQSIYSWRGADIRNILDFEKDYPEATTIKLEQNYRSTQIILDAAHEIIKKNVKRKDKKLWTEQEGGDKIQLLSADNERHEGDLILQRIIDSTRGHESPPYNDFAVLYRTNAQSRVLEEMFLKYGIPYRIVGGIKFYERKEIKDIISYLRVLQNPNDSVSLLRIINVPARKIGAKTIEAFQLHSARYGTSLYESLKQTKSIQELNDGKIKAIEKFLNIIEELKKVNRQYPASGVIKHVLKTTGYEKMLNDGTVEGEARLENVYELISVASKYNKLEPGMSLDIFLEEIALITDLDSVDEKENAVIMMTVHTAKGLEFEHVFISGLEEGIFPHSRSMLEPDEFEEERRLMYVATTRAKRNLYLLYAKQRLLYGESQANSPSQFIFDIPEKLVDDEYGEMQRRKHRDIGPIGDKPLPMEEESVLDADSDIELSEGDKIMHNTFGKGVVVQILGNIAVIAFEDKKIGIKKILLSIAPIQKI